MSTTKFSQSLRLDAELCCWEEGLFWLYCTVSLGIHPEIEKKGCQTWVVLSFISRECHHRLDGTSKCNVTISKVSLTLKWHIREEWLGQKKKRRAPRERDDGVGWWVWVGNEMFSEDLLCAGHFNPHFIICFSNRCTLPPPQCSVPADIRRQCDFHTLRFSFTCHHPSLFFNNPKTDQKNHHSLLSTYWAPIHYPTLWQGLWGVKKHGAQYSAAFM